LGELWNCEPKLEKYGRLVESKVLPGLKRLWVSSVEFPLLAFGVHPLRWDIVAIYWLFASMPIFEALMGSPDWTERPELLLEQREEIESVHKARLYQFPCPWVELTMKTREI
jgi:hypothetical protein